MLDQLMKLIVETKGSATMHELARKMQVGDETIRMMIQQLTVLGYLDGPDGRPESSCCAPTTSHCAGCHGCSLSQTSSTSSWGVTEKGMRLARAR